MHWLFGAARLRRLGILGINRRNAECILDNNPRALFPLVDDKHSLHDLCRRIGVPTPPVFAHVSANGELRRLPEFLSGVNDFVLKPNRGSAGRGIVVVTGRAGDDFVRNNGDRLSLELLRQHTSDILSGMYSLGGHPDAALFQYRVHLHSSFESISFKGIPDIRVIVYRGEPAMAMLRLPTKASNGRANLHQGGIGAGIEIDSGRTSHAVQFNKVVSRHPDTGASLVGHRIPCWSEVLELARKVARAVGLGYVGVDVVLDGDLGPLLLEANARPGLAIQIANGLGIVPRLEAIDAARRFTPTVTHKSDSSRPSFVSIEDS
jgi:alpha-L-glutamate ligase-like protein